MGTQSTGGGSTTSFTNTPQAMDDSYIWTEDQLLSLQLYNAATKTITLDVMSNDLGGNAKTLFSVDDGDGNPITADYELLAKDVGILELRRAAARQDAAPELVAHAILDLEHERLDSNSLVGQSGLL